MNISWEYQILSYFSVRVFPFGQTKQEYGRKKLKLVLQIKRDMVIERVA